MRAWIMERVLRRVYWSNWRAEKKKAERECRRYDVEKRERQEWTVRGREKRRKRDGEEERDREREKDVHDASVGRHANLSDPRRKPLVSSPNHPLIF